MSDPCQWRAQSGARETMLWEIAGIINQMIEEDDAEFRAMLADDAAERFSEIDQCAEY